MTTFEQYSQILLGAFIANHKNTELITKKQSLLDQVFQHYQIQPKSVLYIGFNPLIFADNRISGYVLGLSSDQATLVKNHESSCVFIDNIKQLPAPVDAIVAFDEYFSFIPNESVQRTQLAQFKSLTRGPVITSLRDYKNQDFRDREFSFPSIVKQNQENRIYLEYHDHNNGHKSEWQTQVYEIYNNQLTVHGPFARQAVYFKQLAKFANDAGFTNFVIHKNLMYKSPIRKNYEHVISFA